MRNRPGDDYQPDADSEVDAALAELLASIIVALREIVRMYAEACPTKVADGDCVIAIVKPVQGWRPTTTDDVPPVSRIVATVPDVGGLQRGYADFAVSQLNFPALQGVQGNSLGPFFWAVVQSSAPVTGCGRTIIPSVN